MYDGIMAETIKIAGHGGDEIAAYFARPLGPGPYPGVVVIHHMPGWDEATKEIARRFATHGYSAICPNLFYREGPDASPDDAAAASRAAGGAPDERVVGDVDGNRRFLLSLVNANGKVGVIGYCSGGRQTYVSACRLPFDAAYEHTLNIDFVDNTAGPGARVAVELSAESARELVRCIESALAAAGSAADVA